MTSYLGCSMETYTSVQAHHSDIRQLELTPAGVLSVADSELRYIARTGVSLYTLRYYPPALLLSWQLSTSCRDEPQLVGMNCLLYVDDSNLLVGCQSGQLASLDLSSMQVTSQVNLNCIV